MAIFSPLRLCRLTDQVAEATQQFITFQLGQQFCAVTIDQLIKVIMTDTTDEAQSSTSSHLVISYKGQELAVWDAGQVLFGQTSLTSIEAHQHMLLGKAAHDQVVVLAINSPPATQTVKSSAIRPIHDLPGITATITTDCQYYVVNLAAIENL